MTDGVCIRADWEVLDEGSPEERACFAALGIHHGAVSLTEGIDTYVNRIRPAPFLSAYPLAEWLTWNWWRWRWEPRNRSAGWDFAHRLATIGAGYAWPDITIQGDGQRTALISRPTRDPAAPFRYLCDRVTIVASPAFEAEVESFVLQVLGQLRAEGIAATNLDTLWQDLCAERSSPDRARRRKLEALLGCDPDSADPERITALVIDSDRLGADAIDEIAAAQTASGPVPAFDDLARRLGTTACLDDAARLDPLPPNPDAPAWQAAVMAARRLRQMERLGDGPIEDARLAALAGVPAAILSQAEGAPGLSFTLDDGRTSHVVLRASPWPVNRRFELARLLGDHLLFGAADRLHPSTRTYTARQKAQRAFAAELLCPAEVILDQTSDDLTEERREDIARHFAVAGMVVDSTLVSHGRLERQALGDDFDLIRVA